MREEFTVWRCPVYRMTLEEVGRFLAAAQTPRERWIARLGVCAGLRREELRRLQGRHLARQGWVWVSADIAKGGRERWVPVVAELGPVVAEITEHVEPGHYVFGAEQFSDPPQNTTPRADPHRPTDGKVIWRTVIRIAERAGIAGRVTPHTMRHAFCDHVARFAGLRAAQTALGHASLSTTEGYLGQPTLDELATAFRGVSSATPHGSGAQTREWTLWDDSRTRP